MLSFPKGGEAGQVAVLEELEGGSSTRRDVVDATGQTELGQRGGAVAPANDGVAIGGGDGLGDGGRTGGEAGVLEDSMGPFQKTVRAPTMTSAKAAAVPGPMSRPFQSAGTSAPTWRTSPLRTRPAPNVPPGLSTVRSVGITICRPDSRRRAQASKWSGS